MHIALVFIEAKPDRIGAVTDACVRAARATLDDVPTCRRLDVATDPIDPASILLYAVFDDAAAWRGYLESRRYAETLTLIEPWIKSRRVLIYELAAHSGHA